MLYASGDSEHLAEVAERRLNSDLQSLGALARRYAESHHAWSGVFDRLFSVYRGVLSG
jgi:hypothetical protein